MDLNKEYLSNMLFVAVSKCLPVNVGVMPASRLITILTVSNFRYPALTAFFTIISTSSAPPTVPIQHPRPTGGILTSLFNLKGGKFGVIVAIDVRW